MKNYIYITILSLSCLAIFIISCQKENSSPEELTPNTTHLSEIRWVEHCDCGDDFGGCKYLCVGENGCCCEITWEFVGQEPLPTGPIPRYCKPWDIITNHCLVSCTQLPGTQGTFCPSRFDVQPNPPLWPTYICVPYNTALRFWNPSATHTMHFHVDCATLDVPKPPAATYVVGPRQSMTLDFDGCRHSELCLFW